MKIRSLLLIVFLACAELVSAQLTIPVSMVDFVKIKNNHVAEALYYYENNWKVYRDTALAKGFIKSYKLMLVTPDTTESGFDLVLITEYPNRGIYDLSEQRFAPIMKSIRPNGPLLLNNIPAVEFRQNLYFRRAVTLFSGE